MRSGPSGVSSRDRRGNSISVFRSTDVSVRIDAEMISVISEGLQIFREFAAADTNGTVCGGNERPCHVDQDRPFVAVCDPQSLSGKLVSEGLSADAERLFQFRSIEFFANALGTFAGDI